MLDLELIPAKFDGAQILNPASYDAVAEKVSTGIIVILKDVFEPEHVIRIRNAAFQWGLHTPVTNPSDS